MKFRLRAIVVVLLSILMLLTDPAFLSAEEPGNPEDGKPVHFQLDLDNDGVEDYVINISSDTANSELHPYPPQKKSYQFMESSIYQYEVRANKKRIGKFTLTLNKIEDTLVYYTDFISSEGQCSITFRITALGMRNSFDYREVVSDKYILNKMEAAAALSGNTVYLDAPNRYMKFNRAVAAKPLGYSVYETSTVNIIPRVQQDENNVTFAFTIPSGKDSTVKQHGILATRELVDWKHDFAVRTAALFDMKEARWFFSDGMYTKNQYNYVPRSTARESVFKAPIALLVRSCCWVLKRGCMFQAMGVNMMYDLSNSYNDQGYLPTRPYSEWLKGDYGIGYNFYDTRWNADSAASLLTFHTQYPDAGVLEKLKKHVEYYKKHFKENSFTVGKAVFVPDYMDYSKKNKTAHCSLNHYLAEMMVLYQFADLTADEEALEIARSIVNSIRITSKKWIKDNGDLWYSVTPAGVFRGRDYPDVTYNDLVNTVSILKKYEGEVPDEIAALLKSKGDWARKSGYLK
jgi:hypothetical protein